MIPNKRASGDGKWCVTGLEAFLPVGRYNGARITGAEIRLCWRYDLFSWRPAFSWRHGEPYLVVLGFRASVSATYHFAD